MPKNNSRNSFLMHSPSPRHNNSLNHSPS